METSLIGKALDFGPKECGFESLVSNLLPYNSTAFLINHINFSIASKRRWITLRCTKKMLKILSLLKKLGVLNSYLILKPSGKFFAVKLSPFFYKSSSFYKNIKLVTTPSKTFNMKLKTLKIVSKSLGETIVILETSRGIITHKDALRLGVSGKILLVLN